MRRRRKLLPLIVLMLTVGFSTAGATRETVDIELILAIDCSYSVDEIEYKLQTRGIAEALRNPETIRAIESGPYQAIALSIVQWSNGFSQAQALPWVKISSYETALQAADLISAMPRLARPGATSLSGALHFSLSVFDQSPYQGVRQIIDISGDGRNNNGDDLEPVRLQASRLGIIINGLPILTDDPTLDIYYQNKVIAGPGAFLVKAEDYQDYIEAIERKILKEIAYFPIGKAPHKNQGAINRLTRR